LGEEVETQMTTDYETRMTTIQSWDEVPAFNSEDEEAAYWETHRLSEALLTDTETDSTDPLLSPRGREHHRAQMISLRLDPELLGQLKQLAAARSTGYQPMIKRWIAERLAEEMAPPPGSGPQERPGHISVAGTTTTGRSIRLSAGDTSTIEALKDIHVAAGEFCAAAGALAIMIEIAKDAMPGAGPAITELMDVGALWERELRPKGEALGRSLARVGEVFPLITPDMAEAR
jgi:predicted DNA binding CopG/RHH family protein